jgi:ubiquinone/menaquinone biosynthesis C-methylase UbiE
MQADSTPLSWKEVEREGWDRNAPRYDARAGQMTINAVEPLLNAVRARAGIRLLDICCGPGYGAGAAAARGSSAVGIDIAPAMIGEARRRFSAAKFHEGDAESLDFPDASFDAAICAFGLLHLPDSARAIAEAFRILRPNGKYAFTVWCRPERARLLGLALKAIASHADLQVPLPPAPAMFELSHPDAATAALTRAGFDDVVFEEVDIEFTGSSTQDVFDWLDKSTVRTMAIFRLQTPDVQERIRAAILEGADEFMLDGAVRIPCPAMLYSARKP